MNSALILVAFAATLNADLQQVLDRAREEQAIVGLSAAVTQGDRTLFAGASGQADLDSGRAMTPDTLMYAGSLSKTLTTIAALQLIEQGRLSLDMPVPGIAVHASAARPPVLLRHLLTHTSGLDREGDFGYWFNAAFPDAKALAAYLAQADLRGDPGAATHYSNIGFAALGRVIEDAGELAFAEALRQGVLLPLGMTSTGAPGPAPGIAAGYTPPGRLMPNAERPFAGVGRRVGDRHVREYHDAKAMTPAFGIYTTARDFGRLARFLLGHGDETVLSREMRRRMLTDEGDGRGLGLGVGRLHDRPVARHGGWFAAHRSYLLLDLESEIGVAVFANSDSAAPPRIAEALLAIALGYDDGRDSAAAEPD